jgi:hypothetical protein
MRAKHFLTSWKWRIGALATAGTLAVAGTMIPQPAQANPGLVWYGGTIVVDGVHWLVLTGVPAGTVPNPGTAAFFEWYALGPAGGKASAGAGVGTIVATATGIAIVALAGTVLIDWAYNGEPIWEVIDAETLGDDDFWDIYFSGETDVEPVATRVTVMCGLSPEDRWRSCRSVYSSYAVDESIWGDTLCSDLWEDESVGADDPQMQMCNGLVSQCIDNTRAACDAMENDGGGGQPVGDPPDDGGGEDEGGGMPDPGWGGGFDESGGDADGFGDSGGYADGGTTG